MSRLRSARLRRVLAIAALVVSLLAPVGSAEAASNPFAFPQCTWFAAQMRPDLVGAVWGNAAQWIDEAYASGYAVGTRPSVGAVAVLQPGVEGADGYGHVAYVTQVGTGGWFQVAQTNWWPFPWQTTYAWFVARPGVQFIYYAR